MTVFEPGVQKCRVLGACRWLLAAAALVATFPVTAVRGQESDELIDEMAVVPHARIFLGEGGFVYQSDADIDGGGSMQVFRYDVGALGRADFTDQLSWTNTLFFGINDYDFSGGGFNFGDPWNVILNLRLATTLTYMFTKEWGASAGGIFNFAPESDADWGDSFTGGGLLAAEYRHSANLSASLGVAVISQIEDDVKVTPAVRVNWFPDPHWAVRVGAVPASGGAAAAGEVAYRFIEQLDLGLGVLYQQRRFRLDDSLPVRHGVGEDNSLPVRLRLGWDINQNFAVNFLAGAALAGELTLEDRNGHELRNEDYDPAAYVGVRLAGGF